ncbi:MAG: AIR synthase-related protein, partial [Caulobacterales bacterium]|nr:AIR synthase-related protein [Caulobacterales bacterium]
GDVLVLIGEPGGDLGQSRYALDAAGRSRAEAGSPPSVDLAAEARAGDFVRALIAEGLANAVHDLSDGGLAVAAAEMALASNVGIRLHAGDEAPLVELFGEGQGRYLLAAPQDAMDAVWERLSAAGVAGAHVGEADDEPLVLGDRTERGLLITFEDMETGHGVSLADLRAAHEGWLPRYMKGE